MSFFQYKKTVAKCCFSRAYKKETKNGKEKDSKQKNIL